MGVTLRGETKLARHYATGNLRSVQLKATRLVKRVADVGGCLVLLLLLLPLVLVIGAAVASDGGPVFFRHRRIGRGGKPFDCLKFRTMFVDAEECLPEYFAYNAAAVDEWAQNQKLSSDPRVTGVGKFLRRSSLDELPQLLNVLRGEMSLVGPRPITQKELERYGPTGQTYMSMRPGITGLWQVAGRSRVDFATRVELDAMYVRQWSLMLDLVILVKTPAVVLSRRGAC